MKTVLIAAWANDNTRGLIRWVMFIPIQIVAWHSVVRFVGESIEAALWTWMVGFAFMMFTELGSK